MNRNRSVRLHLVLPGLLLALLFTGCAGLAVRPSSASPSEAAVKRPARSALATPPAGLQFLLREGAEQPSAPEVIPAALAQPLTETETNAILDRLAPLPARPEDAQEFAYPSSPVPAPRPGQTVNLPFPPPTAPAPPAEAGQGGALTVLRYAPEGDVPLAANLSVTFDRPMVALTSLADLAAQAVPVKLSPQPAGKWRWVGTKTLAFEPQATETTGTARLPMATKYTAEIPAGVAAASGVTLTKSVTWTFTTPPPQIVTSYPGDDSQPRDPLIFIAFDQSINPAAVLETIKVEVGRAAVAIRLATEDEVRADSVVAELAKNAGEGRWLAFRPQKPLQPAVRVTVKVGPGTPSAEGPLVTQKEASFAFTTYGPLVVRDFRCGWGEECPPLSPWYIEFSNPLDEAAFASEQVSVTPELPGQSVALYGNTLAIHGTSRGRTTYTVRLSGAIQDTFGQTLGQDQTLKFKVTSARPTLWGPGENLVTLDPSAKTPTYSVFSINYDRLAVTAYAVTPADWTAFQKYLSESWRTDQPPALPGHKVLSQTLAVKARPDEMVETTIDLREALSNDLGHVILVVQPDAKPAQGEQLPKIVKWIQATRIGLDAFVDNENLLAWANSLADGAPLAEVKLTLLPGSRAATTAANGMAILPLPFSGQAQILVAQQGDDTALLPANPYYWSEGGWAQQPRRDMLRWYVFDDRGLYRPGEEVHVKGWIRKWGAGPRGDISAATGSVAATGAADEIGYALNDSQGNRLLTGAAKVNVLGGFDLVLKLPEAMNLGDAPLELNATGGSGAFEGRQYVLPIQVQEFRRPEFEVKAAAVSEGPFFVGSGADLEATASYYAGGALPNAETTWRVTTSAGHYSPPGWDDFTFGRWIPWWRMWDTGAEGFQREETFAGRTDAGGVHRLHLDFVAVNPPEPSVVTAEATVMDVNRQAWTSTATLLVHPADLYVGLRSERLFVQQGEPLKVDVIVTDLDGKAIADREVKVQAARLAWRYKGGTWQEEEASSQACTVRSAKDPVRCTFDTAMGGTYRVTATVLDDRERTNRSELTLWVAGGERPPEREVKQEEVTLIPNGKNYQPGDVAEILVQTPFYPAEGLLTLRRSGMVNSERFKMDGPTTTLRVKIEEAYTPNVHVQVDLVGAATRSDDKGEPLPNAAKRPAYASGEINLSVPPLSRTLALEAIPRDEKLEPGGKTAVTVTVRDATGQPVSGAEVAIVVVDEAILALTNYDPADPVSVFYEERSADVSDHHARSSILLVNPAEVAQGAQVEGMGGGVARAMATAAPAAAPQQPMFATEADMAAKSATGAAPAIAVRSDFNPLATFVPAAATDTQGRAVVEVKLPDNLTRYRVIAVAVAGGKQFGKAESAITARLPLMVRPSPPRFLNFGDRFELPVVVQNQTDVTMTVDVAVRAANAALTAGSGRRVTVPPNDRVEVRFPVTTISAGTARFQVGAAAGKSADAAQFELPVWTPATTEAFAVYGEVDAGSVAQPVIAPSGVYTQFGGLEISTSSTALQALTDAVLYLTAYPFECTEQMASRVLAVAALRDVLTAFQAEGLPANAEIEARVAKDIAQLRALQNDDGGWPVWRRGDESWPFHSIHVANALQRARAKGYDVPPDVLERAKSYLSNIEQRYPSWYPQEVKWTLTAYALNVRAQLGDRDTARARSLIKEAGLEKLSLEAVGWLLPVLSGDPASQAEVTAIRRLLLNRVTETAGAAHFVTSYGDNGYLLLHSDRRADGILLDALIGDQPDSDLIPKIVRGLLGQRKAGRWMNTQENVFILLALDRYFNTYETQTPDFVARIWLGDQYAGEATFKGRTTEYQQIAIPMKLIAAQDDEQNLILNKEGPGRLYYRLGLRYAPTDLKLPPYDAGFTVERTYQAVDKPGDVTRDADGTWRIKAGARVRVSLTLVAPARRYHVALVDPLPAGLEALNPALAVTGSLPPTTTTADTPQSRWYWWWRPWYEHENLRDERVEAFASLLWDGVWSYSYVARATTPGTFVVPPTKAEEMYAPETFGRSGVDMVVVE